MKPEPFIIERTYNAPIEKVWKALTGKDQMKQWYFNLTEFKAEVGFEFKFEGGPPEKSYVHLCRISEVVVNKKLSHSWKYEGYAGESFVTWELFPDGNRTLVKLTHAGLETFPIENKDFAQENFISGWNEIVGSLLKDFVEKQ
ncbi:SRPBCC domain-containing protein [soil metagenome]